MILSSESKLSMKYGTNNCCLWFSLKNYIKTVLKSELSEYHIIHMRVSNPVHAVKYL